MANKLSGKKFFYAMGQIDSGLCPHVPRRYRYRNKELPEWAKRSYCEGFYANTPVAIQALH